MAHGRQMAWRQMLIAQAAVLFFDGRPEALAHFIRTGSLDSSKRNVLPCTPAVLEAMQAQIDQRRAANQGGKKRGRSK